MCFGSRKPVLSKAVPTLLGTFLILTVFAAFDALAAGTWSTTGSMTVARENHTATLLLDGRVLVAGGGLSRTSAELYNPTTGTWSPTGSTSVGGFGGLATLLLDGRVLVAGGGGDGTRAELYDPTTGTWSATGSMSVARFGFTTATRLPDGRVLVAGGIDGLDNSIASVELYDPTAGTWSATGSMIIARSLHTATLLLDGRVLVAGCCFDSSPKASAEIYDPTTQTWSLTGSMSTARDEHTATLLRDGTVLVAGGVNNSAERYDPKTATWSVTGSMSVGRFEHTATLLTDGRVLVAGGLSGIGIIETSSELYDPTTGEWTPTFGSMSVPRVAFTATRLPDGRVLVAGGVPNGTSAELFNPSPLLAAVLPTSRSVQVGTPATAFATIINTGTSTATGCQIAPGTTLPASFVFQTTDPATNAMTGPVNTPVDIPANKGAQTFVFFFTPTAAIPATDVPLNFSCANAMAAPVVSGLNTLLLSASTTPVPDIVAISATLKNDGIVNISGSTGTGIFSVAAMNLGAGATITVSADTGVVALPVRIALCQTDPSTGQCMNPTVPTTSPVVTIINANEAPTFGIFVTGTSTVAFAPATSRIFVRFKDAGTVTHGSTSVAVRTQ